MAGWVRIHHIGCPAGPRYGDGTSRGIVTYKNNLPIRKQSVGGLSVSDGFGSRDIAEGNDGNEPDSGTGLAGNLFLKHIQDRHGLIKDNRILQTTYIPDELPHRESEINAIVEILAPALQKNKPSNILVFGKTGTGKTAVMNFIGRELKGADPLEENVCFVYINCEVNDTLYGILYSIANQISNGKDHGIPFTGWSVDKVLAKLAENADEMDKVFIVVLDEIDRSIQKNGDDIFYFLTTINEVLRRSRVSIIGITNNAKFTELLNSKIKSRLGEEKLVFPPYSVEQLKDILYARASSAFDDGVLDEDVIPLCAAVSARESGDARRALELLRISAEMAERNRDPNISSAHVYAARNKLEQDAIMDIISTLTIQSKILLMGIIRNHENEMRFMTVADVYPSYRIVCEAIGQSALSQRHISSMIQELDMLGIVHARVKSNGGAVRTKEIELCISAEVINMVKADDLFLDWRNRKQTTLM